MEEKMQVLLIDRYNDETDPLLLTKDQVRVIEWLLNNGHLDDERYNVEMVEDFQFKEI